MNQKLDVGGTLSQIFSTYGAQAGVLLPIAFALFVVVAVRALAVAAPAFWRTAGRCSCRWFPGSSAGEMPGPAGTYPCEARSRAVP